MQSAEIFWVIISKNKILRRKVINKLCTEEGLYKELTK